ncbi:MAG: hypothetical protein M0Z94_19105 [Dehalococcoidales bacterium]|nr:hypothetical protein [Dehalococcoidales bacterium]
MYQHTVHYAGWLSGRLGWAALSSIIEMLGSVLVYVLVSTTRAEMAATPSGPAKGQSPQQAARETVSRHPKQGEKGEYGLSDSVRWGPTLAGLFVALGFVALSSSLGLAVSLSTTGGNLAGAPVDVGDWVVITPITAGFLGGWPTAKALAVGDLLPALINSVVVWCLLTAAPALILIPVVSISGANVFRRRLRGNLPHLGRRVYDLGHVVDMRTS